MLIDGFHVCFRPRAVLPHGRKVSVANAAARVTATQITPEAIMAPVVPWARAVMLSNMKPSLCSRRGNRRYPGLHRVLSRRGQGGPPGCAAHCLKVDVVWAGPLFRLFAEVECCLGPVRRTHCWRRAMRLGTTAQTAADHSSALYAKTAAYEIAQLRPACAIRPQEAL